MKDLHSERAQNLACDRGRRSDANDGDATGSATRHGAVPPPAVGTACSLRFGEARKTQLAPSGSPAGSWPAARNRTPRLAGLPTLPECRRPIATSTASGRLWEGSSTSSPPLATRLEETRPIAGTWI